MEVWVYLGLDRFEKPPMTHAKLGVFRKFAAAALAAFRQASGFLARSPNQSSVHSIVGALRLASLDM